MADKTYVVTAACAVIYNTGRTGAVTIAKGGAVPSGSDPEHIDMLLERGMIAEGEAAGGVDTDPDAAPAFVAESDEVKPKGRGRVAESDEANA